MIEVFGIAFSIMGLLPSIASTLVYSIPAGPAGMVWVGEIPGMKEIEGSLRGLGLVSCLWLYFYRWTGHGIFIRLCAAIK